MNAVNASDREIWSKKQYNTYRKLVSLNLQKGDYISYSQAAGKASVQGRLSFHQGIMSYCKESY